MTATVAAPTTSGSRTPRQIWQRARGLLLAVLVLVVAGVTLAAVRSGGQHGRLDPRSADPYGSRAVAELLKDRGVSVDVATTLDEAAGAVGPDTTLLVAGPDMLTAHQQQRLHTATADSAGRTVLIAPDLPSVARLAPGVRPESHGPVATRPPLCDLPAARAAGPSDIGGIHYVAVARDAIVCYPDDDGRASLLLLPGHRAGDTVLLGSPDILYNDRLDQQGNASLGLQLLGSRPHLVWYLPSLDDPSAAEGDSGSQDDSSGDGTQGESDFLGLIPPGWLWGALQLALAAGLAAIWRARRFGPLVTERLPVAVRASEATEGRARLYRKADARDRAAASLRSATRSRISPLLGVSPRDSDSPAVLLPAVATRLITPGGDLGTLLFGPAPTDDAALVLLTDQLDALEREVRTS
ncbi:MAG TPA: DUF4350 domain-containing protein [Streptomyces sp.]|uniref:DUF4350 domain-containing protein n=1 Tax=Streptomyces sp. TaxID=1931 RepID=UPI002D0CCF37|nr:DUF4350 domain-containing protein [Streptomyces sp.]HWU10429.1 DUF4350 domain-containing protein [Streptomyces sp.]